MCARPVARRRPRGEVRAPVSAPPEQVEAVGFGGQQHRVGVGEPVGPADALLQRPDGCTCADVARGQRRAVVHVRTVVARPEHGEAAVGLDQDRRVAVIVVIHARDYDRPRRARAPIQLTDRDPAAPVDPAHERRPADLHGSWIAEPAPRSLRPGHDLSLGGGGRQRPRQRERCDHQPFHRERRSMNAASSCLEAAAAANCSREVASSTAWPSNGSPRRKLTQPATVSGLTSGWN